MTVNSPSVFIVDDDPGVRDALRFAISNAGYHTATYESAESFLRDFSPSLTGCMVLDVRMPGTSGMELHRQLRDNQSRLPVIFLTGHGDISMCADAMKSGAVDFIEKPFDHARLLGAVKKAIDQCDAAERRSENHENFSRRRARLTARENEVMDLLIAAKNTKQIGAHLGISTKTVDNHRGKILEKMQVDDVVELVRLALMAGFGTAD
jgi:two-component system response regulator FixJ